MWVRFALFANLLAIPLAGHSPLAVAGKKAGAGVVLRCPHPDRALKAG